MDRARHPARRNQTRAFRRPGPGKDDWHITFTADDLEATAAEMKAKGVEFAQEPEKADWGTAAIFKDPDGNQFVLSSS
jgi:predicted enzyme related to lactoylglutathione lyase